MGCMDRLPTVISCCFCCFLRAGTIVIALVSFMIGLLFVPNLSQTPGFWNMKYVLGNYSAITENTLQLVLGVMSLMICICSVLLLVGVCVNIPKLILIYQWGAVVYSTTMFLMFLVSSIFSFFIYANCNVVGAVLVIMMVFEVLCTWYFVIVTNSLRMSIKEVLSEDAI